MQTVVYFVTDNGWMLLIYIRFLVMWNYMHTFHSCGQYLTHGDLTIVGRGF